MAQIEIPLGAFEPDATDPGMGGVVAWNVVPIPADGADGVSYGPFPSIQALGGPIQGNAIRSVFAAVNATGTTVLFAASDNAIAVSPSSPVAWVDVTGGEWTLPINECWQFAQFNLLVFATCTTMGLWVYDLSQPIGSTRFTQVPAYDDTQPVPIGRFLANVRAFLITGNFGPGDAGTTSPATDPGDPFRIWWSSQNDPEQWPDPGSNAAAEGQSDYNDFDPRGGVISGFATNVSGVDALVFQSRSINRMSYIGPAEVFSIQVADGVRGCVAPLSIVPVGSSVFFLAEDGFYSTNGYASEPIGYGKVDRWFAENSVPYESGGLDWGPQGIWDPVRRVIIWSFYSTAAPTGLERTRDQALIYNPQIGRWSLVTSLAVTAIGRLTNDGESGGVLAGNQFGTFTGPALGATVSTEDVEFWLQTSNYGRRAYVQGVRVATDALLTKTSVYTRANRAYPTRGFGPGVSDVSGFTPVRADGRFVRVEIEIPSPLAQPGGADWSYVGSPLVRAVPSGWR